MLKNALTFVSATLVALAVIFSLEYSGYTQGFVLAPGVIARISLLVWSLVTILTLWVNITSENRLVLIPWLAFMGALIMTAVSLAGYLHLPKFMPAAQWVNTALPILLFSYAMHKAWLKSRAFASKPD